MAILLYLIGLVAALAYGVAVIVLAQQSDLLAALTAVNPLWLLVAVVALGLGRLVALAEAASETLRRLDGWRTAVGSRVGVRGGSVVEVLEQIRDRQPPRADAEPDAGAIRRI